MSYNNEKFKNQRVGYTFMFPIYRSVCVLEGSRKYSAYAHKNICKKKLNTTNIFFFYTNTEYHHVRVKNKS